MTLFGAKDSPIRTKIMEAVDSKITAAEEMYEAEVEEHQKTYRNSIVAASEVLSQGLEESETNAVNSVVGKLFN